MNCKTCAGPCCLKGSNHEGDCEGYKPLSHYDQIKAMSVEEMAEFCVWMCPPGSNENLTCEPERKLCSQCWLDWLKGEAEESE